MQNGRRFFSDGWNDVVYQLEFFLDLDHFLLLLKVLAEPTPHLQHGLSNLVHHLAVFGKGFLGFRCELNVRAGQVDKNGRWSFWNPPPTGLVHSILAPIHRFDGFRQQATTLLVHQRDPICKTKHFDGLVRRHTVSKNEANFDLIRVALRDGRRTRHRGDKAGIDGL